MSNVFDSKDTSVKQTPVKALKPTGMPKAKPQPTKLARRDPRRKRG